MPALGSSETFDGCPDQFECYLERVNHYLIANSIGEYPEGSTSTVIEAADRKKLSIFLTILGSRLRNCASTCDYGEFLSRPLRNNLHVPRRNLLRNQRGGSAMM